MISAGEWRQQTLLESHMKDEDLPNMIEFKVNRNQPDWKDISAKSQALKCY